MEGLFKSNCRYSAGSFKIVPRMYAVLLYVYSSHISYGDKPVIPFI
jgi:hypothetical protein